MWCKRDSGDPLLRHLLDKEGLNLLMIPRGDLNVGNLLVGDGDKVRRASFTSVFGTEPKPVAADDGVPFSLSFDASNHIDAKAGGSLAGNLLAGLGLKSGKLDAALNSEGAESLVVSLIAPSRIVLANFDAMLEELRDKGTLSASYEDRALYVITCLYYARGMRLGLHRKDGAHLSAKAETAKDLTVSGKLDVTAEDDGSYGFRAEAPLAFGFTVAELRFQGGTLTDVPNDKILRIRGGENSPQDRKIPHPVALSTTDAFVKLD